MKVCFVSLNEFTGVNFLPPPRVQPLSNHPSIRPPLPPALHTPHQPTLHPPLHLNGKQGGFTLVEALVAFSILLGGVAVFLWQMRQQSHAALRQSEYLFALECAQSDVESLHDMPPEWVHDTAYSLPRASGQDMHLVRLVYDTAEFSESGEYLKLDSQLQPLALKEPREVQVKVYRKGESLSASDFPFRWGRGLWRGSESDSTLPLVQLTVRLPEYLP